MNITQIELIKKEFDKVYGFNIYRTDNKRHKVYARKTFAFYCRKLEFTYMAIGEAVNVDHATCMHYEKTIHTITRIDKINFNKIVDTFDENITKFDVELLKQPISNEKIKLKGILSDFNILLELNDDDILEFKETRLKPFIRMKQFKTQIK